MTTIASKRSAVAQIRLGAGGFAVMMLGVIFFMLTADWSEQAQDDRAAWTWMLIAFGIAGVLGGVLIGRRSRVARVTLWIGIAVVIASTVALRIMLNVTA